MKRYMLDTNTVSHLLKAHPTVARRMVEVPMASLSISAITEGELLLAWRSDRRQSDSIPLCGNFYGVLMCCPGTMPFRSVTERYGPIWRSKAIYSRRLIC